MAENVWLRPSQGSLNHEAIATKPQSTLPEGPVMSYEVREVHLKAFSLAPDVLMEAAIPVQWLRLQ